MVDQTGSPVFVDGDAPWSAIVQATHTNIDTYLNDRQRKGVNAILVNLIEHKFGTNAPRDIAGNPPFTGTPFTTPNDAYFAHADYLIQAAAQRGIVVLLDPLYLGYNCGDEGWCAEVQAASTADLQQWAEYVGSRYKSDPNITWVVGGDIDPTSVSGLAAKVNAFATALHQVDPGALITAHNVRGEMAVDPWPTAPWLTLNDIYSTYQETAQAAQSAYRVSPAKPYFQIEGWYENEHNMTSQQLRAQAYWTVLSGGMGSIFGNCPLWGFGTPAASFCPSTSSDWTAQLNSPGSLSMMHVAELFRPRAWYNLVPDTRHVLLTSGYGTSGGRDYATAAETLDGTLAMAYLPTVRTVTVDLRKLAGLVIAQWYDPASGTYTSTGGSPFPASGTQSFTPPSSNSAGDVDWVLVLHHAKKAGSKRRHRKP